MSNCSKCIPNCTGCIHRKERPVSNFLLSQWGAEYKERGYSRRTLYEHLAKKVNEHFGADKLR
jgi:hypothetical protein